MTRKSLPKMAMRAVIVVVLLTASVLVWNRLPYPTDVEAPFPIRGAVGETIETPTVAVMVKGAKVGTQLKLRNSMLKTSGRWIMVGAKVTSLKEPGQAQANLLIGGRTYTPDARSPFGTFTSPAHELSVGIPQQGVWVFEVPEEAVGSNAATAELRVWVAVISVVPRYFPRIPSIRVPLDEEHASRVQTIVTPDAVMGDQ
ncbi:MAG: hypothetical protein ACRDUS_17140 [Mycobacterium sp.]